jgi:hypothetical protein
VTRASRTPIDIAIAAGLLLLGGAGSLLLGQDNSGDLRAYHFYQGYAVLTGRLDRDIAPANLCTFFSPTMDILHYWGMSHLPARLFAFLLGAVHALGPLAVYAIGRLILDRPPATARAVSFLAAVLAGLGPSALMLLGTASGDSLAALPLLAGLLVVIAAQGDDGRLAGARPVLLAGLLGGIAVALKLTAAPFAAGLGAALLFSAGLRPALLYAAGAAGGYLAAAGYWCLQLWRHFGNPLFPFANQIFRSPYFDSVWRRDENFHAHTVLDYLRVPMDVFLGDTRHLQEFPIRDARLLVLLLAALGYGAWWAAARTGRVRPPGELGPRARLLLAYLGAAYAIWLVAFYYYRYLFTLELLAPLAVFVLLGAMAGPSRRTTLLIAAVAVGLTLWSRFNPWNWGRSWTWHDGGFSVTVPPLGRIPDAIVLEDIPGNAFIIPFFPVTTRFLNLNHGCAAAFDADIVREVTGHTGPVLFTPPIGNRRLALFGLRDTGHCELVRTDHGKFGLCLAERIPR